MPKLPQVITLYIAALCALWSSTAIAQGQAFVHLSENDQLVICDNPDNDFEVSLFSRLVQKHPLIFFSQGSPGSAQNAPRLLGKQGEAFYAAKSTHYLMDLAIVRGQGCYPLNDAELQKLRKGLDAKIQLESEVMLAVPEFKATVENSTCFPVFRVPLSPKETVWVSRIVLGPQRSTIECVENFERFVKFKP